MTSIDFYTHVQDRLGVAAKLVAKAVAAHGSVRVLTPDAAATAELDRLLWSVPATGFLPHCRMDSPLAAQTPAWIDHRLEHAGPARVLDQPPPAAAARSSAASSGWRKSSATRMPRAGANDIASTASVATNCARTTSAH